MATRAIHALLDEPSGPLRGLKPEQAPGRGFRDTLAGADQDDGTGAPAPPRRDHHRYPPSLELSRPLSRGAASIASADGLPVPLGASDLSPVPRGAGRALRLGSRAASESGAVARSRQAVLLGPSRPAPAKIWKRRFVKLLVVGDSGLGKTTLISSLLNTAQETVQVHDGTSTSLSDFRRDPDSLVTSVSWKDEEAREVWSVRIQDTPGYGDDTNIQTHIDMIMAYVEQQNRTWLQMESAKERMVDMSEVDDPRVDAVVMCLPPHRLRGNDVRYMHQLGRLVPIIPVITKADTMTINEAQRFRQEVAGRLQNPEVRGIKGAISTFGFSSSALERAGLDPTGPSSSVYPFVVISSNDVHQGMLHTEPPVYWPQRAYRWGTAEAFNAEHSDLLALRALLLSEALEELAAAKRARYEEWRRAALRVPLMRRLRRRAARLAVVTLLPAAGVAFAAAHDFDGQRMKAAISDLKDDLVAGAKGRRAPRRARGRGRGGEGGWLGAGEEDDGEWEAEPAAPAAAAAAPEQQQQAAAAAAAPEGKPRKRWF